MAGRIISTQYYSRKSRPGRLDMLHDIRAYFTSCDGFIQSLQSIVSGCFVHNPLCFSRIFLQNCILTVDCIQEPAHSGILRKTLHC